MNTESVLKIENLKLTRGKKEIIHNMSLSVEKAQIIGLVGPNGAGKSTLIKTMAGLLKKDNGKMSACGVDYDSDKIEYLKKFQFCFDKADFYNELSCKENLMQVGRIFGCSTKEIGEVIENVGLGDRVNDAVSSFSFGMRQRLNIAQILLRRADINVMDEPFNGVDPEGVVQFRESIKKIRDELDCTFLISSHLLSELRTLCDKIIFICKGDIVDSVDLESDEGDVYILNTDDSFRSFSLLDNAHVDYSRQKDSILVNNDDCNLNTILKILIENDVVIKNIERCNKIERIYMELIGD